MRCMRATHARLGLLVGPAGRVWIVLLWDVGQKPMGIITLPSTLAENHTDEAVEKAEAMLTEQDYQVLKSAAALSPGWSAMWDLIDEDEVIEAEAVDE